MRLASQSCCDSCKWLVHVGDLHAASTTASSDLAENERERSAAALARVVLGKELPKDPELRLSDWEALPLSPQQQGYAAADAYASLRICQVLLQKSTGTRPVKFAVLACPASRCLHVRPGYTLVRRTVGPDGLLAPKYASIHLHVLQETCCAAAIKQ